MNSLKKETPIGELGLSWNYFNKSLLPDLPTVRSESVSVKQPYMQNDRVEVLYVVAGSGLLEVNGQSFEINPGSCFILFFYHFFRIVPIPGTAVEIVSLQIPYNSYLFFSTAPNWDLAIFEQTLYLPQAVFCGKVRVRCEGIITSIKELLSSSVVNREQQIQILLAELIARLFREAL